MGRESDTQMKRLLTKSENKSFGLGNFRKIPSAGPIRWRLSASTPRQPSNGRIPVSSPQSVETQPRCKKVPWPFRSSFCIAYSRCFIWTDYNYSNPIRLTWSESQTGSVLYSCESLSWIYMRMDLGDKRTRARFEKQSKEIRHTRRIFREWWLFLLWSLLLSLSIAIECCSWRGLGT